MSRRLKKWRGWLVVLWLFSGRAWSEDRPNIILIMVDDFGHECVESYGGESYSTPQLTRMASEGAQFNQAHAQNICTPSRVQIMTGQYNVRNYVRFATLDQSQHTFGQAFRCAGYATAVVGKWQLGGDAKTIAMLGFDEHCLWNIRGAAGERYVSPTLLTNGEALSYPGKYGPELQQDFAKRFIMEHVDRPFFLYYPMTLPHYPFQPTPHSSDWDPDRDPSFNEPAYFGEMVAYLDYLVGDLIETVDQAGLAENTLILFTADNGTDHRITSFQEGVAVRGAKGKMTMDATQVPFLVRWPSRVAAGLEVDGLIDFSDIFSTFRDIAGLPDASADGQDGVSFLPLLESRSTQVRDHSYCWYMERTDMTDIKCFVQNETYKLHSDGRFINKKIDRFEKSPLPDDRLTTEEIAVKERFAMEMQRYGRLRPKRFAYNHGRLISLPGRVEAEQYDLGLPGVTYYDKTEGNAGAGFWRSDDVDIVSENDHHRIIQMETGEWLEYSVDIDHSGLYALTATYAATRHGAIRLFIQGEPIGERMELLPTEGKQPLVESVAQLVQLPAGRHSLRLYVDQGGMELDRLTFRLSNRALKNEF
ncbi:MAG: hypothetical protein CBE26_02280 [Kiritimatiellaceae bacterium TMED266]|nr:MAG: hypothetical protein CBE26_02280 [Kiritimatiellaceae bacterium TMED266]